MGSSTSSTVSGHKKDNLCNQRDVVERELNLLDESRTIVRRRTLIMIVNKSKKYPLVHSSHGDSNGYFFSDAQTAFQHNYKFLDKQYENAIVPGETGGILHSQYAVQDIFGSSGYVSFMVPTEGKNYVVCCGFYNTTLSATSAGIEIRGFVYVMFKKKENYSTTVVQNLLLNIVSVQNYGN